MADLANMTRDELNAHAESLGFPNPAAFPGTKAELIAALEAFQADGTVSQPEEDATPDVSGDLTASSDPESSPAEEEATDGEGAEASSEISDTFLQEVHAYLADPVNVRAPAAVINFGEATPIRPVQE